MNPEFDPSLGFFQAQEHRPAALQPATFSALPPFLRSLLVKDGTVTHALAAYFLAPVATQQLEQIHFSLDIDHRWLELPADRPLVRRQVILTNGADNRLLVFAESLLAIDSLPAAMQKALTLKGSNLGQLLRKHCHEYRREGLWYGQQTMKNLPAQVATQDSGGFISRSYRILARGKPIILVSEHFPMSAYRQENWR